MEHDRNVLFQGAIPENYDRYLGPVMFEPWAEDLVLRLAGRKYERVLERSVDAEDLIEAVAKRIAERFGAASVGSTLRAIVWQAMKS